MRFSSPSSVSSKEGGVGKGCSNQPSPRRRKKHKRLDAICENEYSRKRVDLNNGAEDDIDNNDSGIRRSSRVRRAPVLLDVSPPPPKKRKKVGMNKNAVSSSGKKSVQSSPSVVVGGSADLDSPGVWKSRLRTRGEGLSPRGKRKVFFEDEESEDEKGVGKYTVVKSKRPGRVKATNASKSEAKAINLLVEQSEEEAGSHQDTDLGGYTEREENKLNDECVRDDSTKTENASEAMECLEKKVVGNETEVAKTVGASDNDNDVVVVEQPEKKEKNQTDTMDAVAASVNETESPRCHNGSDDPKGIGIDEESQQVKDKDVKVENPELGAPKDMLRKPRIKEGRRCGLCGGGTDGKPPKPLAQGTAESENEVYSGSSGSEEPKYDIWDGFGDESSWLGRLLGPINDRHGIAGTWVHQHCAVWSPEVFFAGLGCLKNVRAALYRGRVLKCTRCGRPGATIGCRVDRCPKTYHLPCARANGCIFDHRKFLIACTDHLHLFQPHGLHYLAKIKKIKAKKMKLELRKLANEASRKDVEAEEKWFENCGEDEEFLKRESKRLHRDLARIAPVYIGGKDSENGKKMFEGWESVAGLQDVIQCMKEVVILPLLYPEFFDNLGLTPPRGVLLHGYPGTGKTLVVRALIGACARGDRRIAYFARKGADCLGKYVGDAERQLRLLFQVAEKSQPSIIFFDEIDGLAPCRSRRQDQTHSSVVSTLLALMDGLKSRGSVIVIGATNRPDAIDPALRRPGRFDREIYFPLPSLKDRAAILSLHTRQWPKQVAGNLLEWVAQKTAGFAGADLQALCTQAAVIGLKRNFPLQEILSAAEKRGSTGKRLPLPSFAVEERDWLEALSLSPPPCSRREAGIAANDVASSPLPLHLSPWLLRPLASLLVSLHLDERVSLPSLLSRASSALKTVMVSTLTKKKIQSACWWSFLYDFIREGDVAREIEKGLLDSGILLGDYSITSSNDFNEEMVESNAMFKLCVKRNGMNLLQPRDRSGFRILIVGNPGSGQRHLASCLVHCFVGNTEIQKVDLATISQEGHGDVVHGITEILMKCAGINSSIVFMPRIDLWAVETPQQVTDSGSVSSDLQYPKKDNLGDNHVAENEKSLRSQKCKQAVKSGDEGVTNKASSAWNLFVEQVESICVSKSMTILATSEVPYSVLPNEIGHFFTKMASKETQSTLEEHTIPRFVVQVDGDFDHDSVINLSSTKLSRDVVQQLIQLIHQRSHSSKTSSKEYLISDFIEDHTPIENHSTESVPKTLPPPPNSRVAKGRSNLHLAISTFGYQILRYPHFAELCWVTSKLKDGPTAEVSGPWKSWPFNSCIMRPMNSLEEIIIGSRSVNIKTKEKSGLVRGLIAVGLSSYKGVYMSLREVSSEVRMVLELLVAQINEKVQAGKDRYRYIRILSQVAYLEDKVNSWAYSLQSLETAAPVGIENSKLNVDDASNKFNESKVVEGNPRLGDGKVVCTDLNKENGDIGHFNSYGGSLQKVVLVDNSIQDNRVDSLESDRQLGGKILNEQNGKNNENNTLLDREIHSNGVSRAEDCIGSTEFGDVCQSSVSAQIPGFLGEKGKHDAADFDKNAKDSNFLSSEATECENLCLYSCCSECMNTLLNLMKKVLISRCKSDQSSWTVDNFHDVVASLSVDLVSAVRRVYADGKENGLVDGKQRTCCYDSENGIVVPVDCDCHSKSPDTSAKFLFRNGVLVHIDPIKDISFHCRFEALCLCSLIDSLQSMNRIL